MIKKNNKQNFDAKTQKKEDSEIYNIDISTHIGENKQKIMEIFSGCFDLVVRDFVTNLGNNNSFIIYFEGVVNKKLIQDNILKPLLSDIEYLISKEQKELQTLITHIKESAVSISEVKEVNKLNEVINGILKGAAVLFIDGNDKALIFGVKEIESRKVDKAENEPVIRGPAEGFVENLVINTALIRKRIKTPNLKMEKVELGRISKTDVVIAYIKGLAEDTVVEEIRQRINKIDIDIIIESGNIEQLIEDSPLSPFPQMEFTERPDGCVMALADGKVLILIDGTPNALILPVVLSDFLLAIEDRYVRTYFAPFIIILRYIAFLIALLAPSFYIAVTTYHQEMLPNQLLITLASLRTQVPFSAFVEAILMEATFELLREAGERLPRTISQSLSIVGAIVVGQAAVQAGLVSPAMVVILSVTATASFVNPRINMSRSIRVLRFPLMIMAAALGIFGIVMGMMVILIHLASLKSVGVSYLSPFTPLKLKDFKEAVLKITLRFSPNRPSYIQDNNIKRLDDDEIPKSSKGDN